MLRAVPLAEWTTLAPSMAGYGYRHLWSYSVTIAERRRARPEMVGVFRRERCVALSSVRTVQLPLGLGGIGYVSGGPLVQRGAERAEIEFAVRELVAEYVEDRGLVLRIAPPIEWVLAGLPVEEMMLGLGFDLAASPDPYETQVIDLEGGADEIRKNFHGKWRNQLKKGLAAGIDVQHSTDDSALANFAAMHDALMLRKSFEVDLPTEFYRCVNSGASPSERFDVLTAHHHGAQVGGHVASSLGETSVYLLGASTRIGNRVNASYVLQWHAILGAIERGMRWYDLGGVDPVANPGVSHFKSRMNGVPVVVPGPFEIAPGALRRRLTQAGERTIRGVRSANRLVTRTFKRA